MPLMNANTELISTIWPRLRDHLVHPGGDRVDDAGDVDRQRGLDVGDRGVAQGRRLGQQAGVGDHDVEAPEAVHGLRDDVVERGPVPDVGDAAEDPVARRGPRRRSGVAGSMSAINDRARRGEAARAPVAAADAAVAAGDQHDLAGQVVRPRGSRDAPLRAEGRPGRCGAPWPGR